MNKKEKIYIAGHNGLVGSAIVRKLQSLGYENLIYKRSKELNLTVQNDVDKFFKLNKPDYVFLAAAKVGGILANNEYPADFIYINLMIQSNVIQAAYKYGVKRLLFLGSSCIYPKLCKQPMKEEYLLGGYLEPTNEPYAIAKIAGLKMCESYNRQYETEFIAVMPTNLYGPKDNFDLKTSHVLPALIRKFHEAKINKLSKATVWGTGNPKREFLYVDDMADGCIFVMNMDRDILQNELLNYPKPCFVNLGTGEDISIGQLAKLIAEIIGYKGEICFDTSKPDGTPQKLLDVSRLKKIGWKASTKLKDGIQLTYDWFLENYF